VSDRVCAIVVTHGRSEALGPCLNALARQTRPADQILVMLASGEDRAAAMAAQALPGAELLPFSGQPGDGFREGLQVARDRDLDWVWLLHDAVADERALEELLGAVARANEDGSPPVLMSSKVVRPDGSLDLRSLGRPDAERVENVVLSFERGLAPLRWSSFVSVLISGPALAEHGLPKAAFAGGVGELEFTARLLRRGDGYLAPRSVVEHEGPARIKNFHDAPSELPAHVQERMLLLRTSAFEPGEKARLGFGMLWATSQGVRSPGQALTVTRAAVKGAFSPIG
jgi:rhamnopyranosyl-N-acetylglucosaminyl-diphospho-decaprenol beta-1,3/1,4-galactofuranosyltransferase